MASVNGELVWSTHDATDPLVELIVIVDPEAEAVVKPVPAIVITPEDGVAVPVAGFVINDETEAAEAIVMPPAELVTVILAPAVIVARTGVAPVDPIGICPLVATPSEVNEPLAFPICRLLLVVPVKLNEAVPPRDNGDPVTVILLPFDRVTELLTRAALGT